MSRTYTKEQVEEILRRAAKSTAEAEAAAGSDSGLSIEDLVQIGLEAGLNVDEVVKAARAVDLGLPESHDVKVFGISVGVSHTAYLPGRITDEEWGSLVSDCRRTFLAKGHVVDSGTLREWSNGNLVVTAEPHGEDTLLRMRTHKGAARQQLGGAVGALAMLLVMSLVGFFGSGVESSYYLAMLIVGAVTIGLGMSATVGTKAWARTRKDQMEKLASRAGARRAKDAPSMPMADTLRHQEHESILDLDSS